MCHRRPLPGWLPCVQLWRSLHDVSTHGGRGGGTAAVNWPLAGAGACAQYCCFRGSSAYHSVQLAEEQPGPCLLRGFTGAQGLLISCSHASQIEGVGGGGGEHFSVCWRYSAVG